jgi:hypothetical protein
MSPNAKERLILSVAGGVVIPSSYFVGVAILTYAGITRFSPATLLPLVWPAYAYSPLIPLLMELLPPDAYIIGLLIVGGTDFIIYSLLTYAVIRWRQRMPRLR